MPRSRSSSPCCIRSPCYSPPRCCYPPVCCGENEVPPALLGCYRTKRCRSRRRSGSRHSLKRCSSRCSIGKRGSRHSIRRSSRHSRHGSRHSSRHSFGRRDSHHSFGRRGSRHSISKRRSRDSLRSHGSRHGSRHRHRSHRHRSRSRTSCCDPCCKATKTKYVVPCYRYEDGRIVNQPTNLTRRACELALGKVSPRKKYKAPYLRTSCCVENGKEVRSYQCKDDKKCCPGKLEKVLLPKRCCQTPCCCSLIPCQTVCKVPEDCCPKLCYECCSPSSTCKVYQLPYCGNALCR